MVAEVVSVQVQAGVCLITVDNPPINATSQAVRQGLMAALADVKTNPSLQAAVIACAGSTFVAGADIREFGLPMQDPILPEVMRAIEECGKPVVAALPSWSCTDDHTGFGPLAGQRVNKRFDELSEFRETELHEKLITALDALLELKSGLVSGRLRR